MAEPPLKKRKLLDVETEQVSQWVKAQLADLGYKKEIVDTCAEACDGYTTNGLFEPSVENIQSQMQMQGRIEDKFLSKVAQGLYNRIHATSSPTTVPSHYTSPSFAPFTQSSVFLVLVGCLLK